jgi:hypothetical protein
MRVRALLIAAAASSMLLTGCAAGREPATTMTSGSAASSGVPAEAEPVMAEYGLRGMDTVEVIDTLDRVPVEDRAQDLMASVRVDELLLSSGEKEVSLTIPNDKFYLSVAPFVNESHDCFYHSLTTCKGELAGKDVQVKIVDDSGKALVDDTYTTFDNGFIGFWLPRDMRGTMTVSYGGKRGMTNIATGAKAPTCLTTLKLA